jgi:hypothetical protein
MPGGNKKGGGLVSTPAYKMKRGAAPKFKDLGSSPAKDTGDHQHPHEKVKNVMGGTKENPTWTKTKGGKSSTYTIDKEYTKKKGGKGRRWVNPEGGSFITSS